MSRDVLDPDSAEPRRIPTNPPPPLPLIREAIADPHTPIDVVREQVRPKPQARPSRGPETEEGGRPFEWIMLGALLGVSLAGAILVVRILSVL